jgi:hypothetical protein
MHTEFCWNTHEKIPLRGSDNIEMLYNDMYVLKWTCGPVAGLV